VPFLFFRSNFRGEPLADSAFCQGNSAEIGSICEANARQAKPPCAPRYGALPTVRTTRHASLPPELLSSQWRHILCASRHAARAGVEQSKGTRLWRSWRHPIFQSSARTIEVRPSRWVCTSSSRRRTRTKTGIPTPSSTFEIARAVRCGVQVKLRAILARPFVVICGTFTNFTNVEMPTRYTPRGRNLQ
jgi:hypothetical protein